MENFVMARMDDHEIDCYHQYIAQTNYHIERPEDGDGLMLEPPGCLDKPQEVYRPVGPCDYPSAAQPFGVIGHRPSARERRPPEMYRTNNVRNGQQAPRDPRGNCGDHFNLFGRMNNVRNERQRPRDMRGNCGDYLNSSCRMNNVRNGPQTPRNPRGNCGDHFNSLPVFGGYQRRLPQEVARSRWAFMGI